MINTLSHQLEKLRYAMLHPTVQNMIPPALRALQTTMDEDQWMAFYRTTYPLWREHQHVDPLEIPTQESSCHFEVQ